MRTHLNLFMKASRIITLIIAVALGIIIATQVKQNKTPVNEKTQQLVNEHNENALEEAKTESLEPSTQENTQSNETTTETLIESVEAESISQALTPDVASDNSQQLTTPIEDSKTPMITLKTNKGDIEVVLNAEKAPLTTENFLKYAKEGHYNGTIFHRVIKGFMIQGGGFESGMEQKKVEGPIPNEANNGLKNDKYTLAMARTSDPHSATAQFFINATNNDFLNFTSESQSGWGYAVFGEVVNGKDVVDAIEQVATSRAGHHGDVPVEDIVIESVLITE